MTTSKLVLGLDSGSQSSRALLFDAEGQVLGQGSHVHQPMEYPEPGAVTQDPQDIRDCLLDAIGDCLEQWGGDPELVVGAALTTQRSTVLMADENGEPLADAVSWLDRRVASIDSEPSSGLRFIMKTLGEKALLPRLLGKSLPRLWREKVPDTLNRAAWIASIEGWLHHQLTGHMAVAPSGVAGAWPFDVKMRNWSQSKILYKLLGYRSEWLPDIVEVGQEIGKLSEEAAERSGLNPGLPLFACGGDKQAEALGSGVRADKGEIASVSLGTGSSIAIPWKRPVSSMKYNWLTMASADPTSWWHEYLLFRGMWTIRWFAQNFARDLEPEANSTGVPVEALLCREAGGIPAGSDGLVIWPRWSPTLQHPDETGTCIGLRETHKRGHFFRALLEGIGFDLRRGLGILESALHTSVKEIRVGGGGARSSVVVQILSDMMGLPVVRPESEELAARGAAVIAAVGAGLHPSLEAAVTAMVPEAPAIQPDQDNAMLYERMYRQVYLPGLGKTRKLSGLLRASMSARS